MNFNQLVKYILEDNASGGGGVFGGGESFGHGGDIGNSDFWNTGDARIPFVIGTFKRNGRVKKRKKRKNAKKRKR
jgi:hypothetical protein